MQWNIFLKSQSIYRFDGFITETEQESLLCQLYLERIDIYTNKNDGIYAIFRVPALQMKDAQLKY